MTYEQWQEHYEAEQTARRQEIQLHLAQGGKVVETFHDGYQVLWPAPHQPFYNTPETIAAHVQKRERGFGLTVSLV